MLSRRTCHLTKLAVIGMLCCSIAPCQARQHGVTLERSAFAHPAVMGSRDNMKAKTFFRSPSEMRSSDISPRSRSCYHVGPIFMSSEVSRDENEDSSRSAASSEQDEDLALTSTGKESKDDWFKDMLSVSPLTRFIEGDEGSKYKKPPPLQVEDTSLLFYDVFLILNLSLSISFWVVHRMSFDFIGSAVSEGSLFSLLWIAAGLYNGAFLYSAVDGHYGSADEKGGPKAAGMLGLHTFIGACNLRVVIALLDAILEHRKVGEIAGEQLIPLEIAFGLVLMSMWRALHSSYTPRL